MTIVEVKKRTEPLMTLLLLLWENSVKSTHLFLSKNDIEQIKQYVPQALKDIPHLIILEDDNKMPVGFMGIVDTHLEMLFISNKERGKGYGKQLLTYGIENYSVSDLAVNEQNPAAKEFYEYMGFKTYKRTESDEQGNPYPLLYMKLN